MRIQTSPRRKVHITIYPHRKKKKKKKMSPNICAIFDGILSSFEDDFEIEVLAQEFLVALPRIE